MNKVMNVCDCVLISLGIGISLTDITNILSIIIMVIDVVWIIVKLIIRIVEKAKKKDYKGIADDIHNASDELKDLKDTIEKKDSKGE